MEKKKLYVLTGFLGAGKTSLLLHLLSGLEGRKIGVIQNEFGKLSVDGERTKMDGIEIVELDFIEGNSRARALYEKFGFRITGMIPNAIKLRDGSYKSEYQMQLILPKKS